MFCVEIQAKHLKTFCRTVMDKLAVKSPTINKGKKKNRALI